MRSHLLNRELDVSDMRSAIESFPEQIKLAFSIFSKWNPVNSYLNIDNVLILGMGGSAIGGDVARVISQNESLVPIFVNRSYNIPSWVSKRTLVLASSYSGYTEETLNAFLECIQKTTKIIIISTGGKIEEYAHQYNLDKLCIPIGYQPRAALGFSFSFIILILNKLGFIDNKVVSTIKNSINPLKKFTNELAQSNDKSFIVAKQIHKTCPIIYGSVSLTWVVALRLRGQLAENAKMLSFHNEFPEQNHNEIEGWTANQSIMDRFGILWLKDKEDHFGIQKRMKISKKLLDSKASYQIEIQQEGHNRIERLLKFIHYVDWISYYAALLNNVDPTPVSRIQELKSKISK